MFCVKCGKKINGNEKYCSNCGSKVINENIQDGDIYTSRRMNNYNNNNIILFITSLISLIIVFISVQKSINITISTFSEKLSCFDLVEIFNNLDSILIKIFEEFQINDYLGNELNSFINTYTLTLFVICIIQSIFTLFAIVINIISIIKNIRDNDIEECLTLSTVAYIVSCFTSINLIISKTYINWYLRKIVINIIGKELTELFFKDIIILTNYVYIMLVISIIGIILNLTIAKNIDLSFSLFEKVKDTLFDWFKYFCRFLTVAIPALFLFIISYESGYALMTAIIIPLTPILILVALLIYMGRNDELYYVQLKILSALEIIGEMIIIGFFLVVLYVTFVGKS